MTLSSLGSGIGLALGTVRAHKLRSFLTVLGVIIGTGAVIGVGSIIAGLDTAISNLLRSFGPNTIIVLRGSAMGNWTPEELKRKPLNLEQARAVEERCPSVEHVSPYLFPLGGIHSARYQGNDLYNIDLGGTEEGYSFGGMTMKHGRFFTDQESNEVHRYYGAVRLLWNVPIRITAFRLFGSVSTWVRPRSSRGLPVLVHVVSQRARVLRLRRAGGALAI